MHVIMGIEQLGSFSDLRFENPVILGVVDVLHVLVVEQRTDEVFVCVSKSGK